ncbi:MAG: DHH family phosphoesterase [Clostridia bacterium]|nr:DHH family phosphoesterase [Clostridia bacterium]
MILLDEIINVLDKSRKVFIQTHNSPDPDAIASAFGLQYLLQFRGILSEIFYNGKIEKYNTLRMIEHLNINIHSINDISHMKEDDLIILVDSQKYNSNITDFIGTEVAVIDHHPTFTECQYKYADIRPSVGACSSIIAEYFLTSDIEIPCNIATALLYAIKTDTLDLSRGVSPLDIDMFYMLYKKSDIKLLNSIQFNTLTLDDLNAYANALSSMKVRKNIGFVNLGKNCSDSLLGTVCDFILSVAEIETAISFSQRDNGLRISIRNESDVLDAGRIINKALEGIGTGGGHKSMAGGLVPYHVSNSTNGQPCTTIEDRLVEAIEKHLSNSNL